MQFRRKKISGSPSSKPTIIRVVLLVAAVALIYTLSNIYYGEEEDYNYYNSYANHSNVTIANNNNTKNVTNDSPPSSVGNINSNFLRREKEARDNDTDVTATSAKEYNDNERRSSSSSETTATTASRPWFGVSDY